MNYNIYCDGSCKNNGASVSYGSWGFAVVDAENHLIMTEYGTEVGNTTNQRMELTALWKAFDWLKEHKVVLANVYTDSAYAHNCYKAQWYVNWKRNNWVNSKKEPVANRDLWEKIIPYFESNQWCFEKVKGHSTNQWNNYIDGVVQNAAEILRSGE